MHNKSELVPTVFCWNLQVQSKFTIFEYKYSGKAIVQKNSNDLSLTSVRFTGSYLAKSAWVFCKRETISKSVHWQTEHMGAADAMNFPSSLQQILVQAIACTLLNHSRICVFYVPMDFTSSAERKRISNLQSVTSVQELALISGIHNKKNLA